MVMTINEFITECENYEYSKDFYEMTKDCLSLKLQTKYLENQSYLIEMAEMESNDNYFTEMPLVLPNNNQTTSTSVQSDTSDSSSGTNNSDESNEKSKDGNATTAWDKIKNGAKLTLNTVKNIFIRLWNLVKFIFRKLSETFPKFGNWINSIMSLEATKLDDDWFTKLADALKKKGEDADDDEEIEIEYNDEDYVDYDDYEPDSGNTNNTNNTNNTADNTNDTGNTGNDTSKSNNKPSKSTKVIKMKYGDWRAITGKVINSAADIQLMVVDKDNIKSEKITRNILRDIVMPDYLDHEGGINGIDAKITIFKYLKNISENNKTEVELTIPGNAPHITSEESMNRFKSIINIISSDMEDGDDKDLERIPNKKWGESMITLYNLLSNDSKNAKYNVTLYRDGFDKLAKTCNEISEKAEKYQKIANDMQTNYMVQFDKARGNRAHYSKEMKQINEKTQLFSTINRVTLYINCAAANTMKIYQGFGRLMKAFKESYMTIAKIANSSNAA